MKPPHQNGDQFFIKKLSLLIFIFICLPSISNAQPSIDTCLNRTTKTFKIFNFNSQTLSAMCNCVKGRNQGKWPTEDDWLKTDKNVHSLMAFDCGKEKITAYHAELLEEGLAPRLKKRGFTPEEIQTVSVCAAPPAYVLARNVLIGVSGQTAAPDKKAVLLKISECEMKVKK